MLSLPTMSRDELAEAYEAAAGNVAPFAHSLLTVWLGVAGHQSVRSLCREAELGAPMSRLLKAAQALSFDEGEHLLFPAYGAVFGAVQRIEKRKKTVPVVRVNPMTLEWARRRSGRLIRRTNAVARNSIRRTIARQMARGMRAESMVDDIRRNIVLLPSQSLAVERRAALLARQGASDEAIRRMTAEYSEQLLLRRALTIARTEVTAAQNQGLLDTWRGAQDAGELPQTVVRVWVSAPPSPNPNRPCPICLELDGLEMALDEPFSSGLLDSPVMRPPAHPNCLPGDALVGAAALASSERWYEGDLVILSTSAGHRLACTPNHPVLTRSGWLPASAIHVGGHVLGGRLGDGAPSETAPIHQVARALGAQEQVPVAAEDFHGDGRGSESATVRTDGSEPEADTSPSDAEGFAQHLLSMSGRVASHRVTGFDVQRFRGPVFNLETVSGAYVAQGLVTHNCRCTMVLRRGRAKKE